MARYNAKVAPKHKMWRKVKADVYRAASHELQHELRTSGLTEADLRRKMGHGYKLLEDALAGKLLTESEACFVEGGLRKDEVVNPFGNAADFMADALKTYPK